MIERKRLISCAAALAICCSILPTCVVAKEQKVNVMEEDIQEAVLEKPSEISITEEEAAAEDDNSISLPETANIFLELMPFEHCQMVFRAEGDEKECDPSGEQIPAYPGEMMQFEIIPDETADVLWGIDSIFAGTPEGHAAQESLEGNVYSFTMPDHSASLYVQMKESVHILPCEHGSLHIAQDDSSYDFHAYVINAEAEEGYLTDEIKAENMQGDVIESYADRNTAIINMNQESLINVSASFKKAHTLSHASFFCGIVFLTGVEQLCTIASKTDLRSAAGKVCRLWWNLT